MKYSFTLLRIFTVILFFVVSQSAFSQVDSDAAVNNGQDSVSDVPPKDDDSDCCEACPIGLPNLPSVTSINGLTVTVSIPPALAACPYYVQYDDGTGAPVSLVSGTTSVTSTYAAPGTYTICVSYISFCERGTCVVEHCFDVTVGLEPSNCEDFNNLTATNTYNTTSAGGWNAINTDIGLFDEDCCDGTTHIKVEDRSGGSLIFNDGAFFSGNWLEKGCELCFDVNFIETNSDCPQQTTGILFIYSSAVSPNSPGSPDKAGFALNEPIVAGSGCHQICLPIALCEDGTLPSNTSGTWTIAGTCEDFNDLIVDVEGFGFAVDVNCSYQDEVWCYDNFCFNECEEDCEDCNVNAPFLHYDVIECDVYICALDGSYTEPCHDDSYTWYVDGVEILGETEYNFNYEFDCNGDYEICVEYTVFLGDEECIVEVCEIISITDCPCCKECNITPPTLCIDEEGCSATITAHDADHTDPCHSPTYTWELDGVILSTTSNPITLNFDCNGEYEICVTYSVVNQDLVCSEEACETITITDCPCCDVCDIELRDICYFDEGCYYVFTAHTDFSDACDNPTYKWYINGSLVGTDEVLQYMFDCNGIYEICLEFTVVAPNGDTCTKITCTTINVKNCRICKGFKTEGDNTQTNISIYPNPASSYFNINSASENEYILNMYNIDGKLIRSMNYTGNASIQLSDEFAAGTYIIHIQGNDINHTEKIQIAK